MCLGDFTSATILATITRPPKKSNYQHINYNNIFFTNSAKSNVYNNQSYNITEKMYMYNCIPTNMLEFHPIDLLDQDHDTLPVP